SPPDALLKRTDEIQARLRPVLQEIDPQLAVAHGERMSELQERLIARAESLKEKIEQPDPPPPPPLAFNDDGTVQLPDWEAHSETEDAVLETVDLPGGVKGYLVRCGGSGECIASWRRTVLLARGEYRLAMSARGSDIVPLPDERGSGAGLRLSGAGRTGGFDGPARRTGPGDVLPPDQDPRQGGARPGMSP